MPSAKNISRVDVLIIGAGPAGLMAANWMSRLGISTRIIDKRADKLFQGQADGLQSRTMEIWDSFGIADRILKESNPMIETCFWNPDENGELLRAQRTSFNPPGLSHHILQTLHQGRIEQFLVDSISEHSDIQVERAVLPEALDFDESESSDDVYPVTVTLRHINEQDLAPAKDFSIASGLYRSNLTQDDTDALIERGQRDANFSETVKAKYVIGCDGAHSWTRRQLGFSMEGEHTEYIWGVIDVIPITDFPDIRCTCIIHSASAGSVMIIPRENNIVRLYIQLQGDVSPGTPFDRSAVSPEVILQAAQNILSPYKLEYVHCDWWTVYRIGQRVSNSFVKGNRIFLAGDAVHTHSPKAGQGQNISMQDTYNLGWKMALVLQGKLNPPVLETYELERRQIARELIEFDHKMSGAMSQKPRKDDGDETEEGVSMTEFRQLLSTNVEWMNGTAINYPPSAIVVKPNPEDSEKNLNGLTITSKQELATKIPIGMRFPNQQVLNQASARPWQLQPRLTSDGRFRILIFGGDISKPNLLKRVNTLGAHLSKELLPRYTSPQTRVGTRSPLLDCIIEVLLIHSTPRAKIELLRDLHDVYHPLDKELGYDYEKTLADETDYQGKGGEAYSKYGIDTERGCVVIVRPDQYVSWVGELEDVRDIEGFFEGILVDQRGRARVVVDL